MVSSFFSRLALLLTRYMPDALVVAILLWLLTMVSAVALTDTTIMEAITAWGDSFWNLLTFTNQVALTLLFGYAFAMTAPMRAILLTIASIVKSPRGAYVLACVVTGLLSLVSWGLSLIAAGILARAIGESCRRRGIRIHYPLLVASSFSGFALWHQGLSATIGLSLATPGHFLEQQVGLIPTSETILTAWNAAVALAVLISLPVVMSALHPREEDIEEMELDKEGEIAPASAQVAKTPGQWVERSAWISLSVVTAGALYLYVHFAVRGLGLQLNIFNFMFLMAGLLFAGSALRFVEIITEGGRIAVPFLLQYPFYAGIAGLMASSGLAQLLIDTVVSVASADTLPLYSFLSGGFLNIFVPSGGGQWALQGPIVMAAAQETGADLARVAMSVALGDQWTNLIQPLALLPVLTVARIGLGKVIGYTLVAVVWTGGVFAVSLLI